jgi:hypothetical protein
VAVIDPKTGEEWVPEFEGQRPPFQPGNTLSVKHGIWSPAKVDPVAEAIVAAIHADDDLSMLRMPAFQMALWAYARTAARVRVIDEWVDSMPIQQAADSDRGKTSPLELLRKWQVTMDNKAARLGLDPVSYAKLHKTVASTKVDLARLLSDFNDDDDTPATPLSRDDDGAATP